MQAIEFQTTMKEIISAMPQEKRDELGNYTEDQIVRVVVIPSPSPQSSMPPDRKDLLQDAKDKGYDDFLEYLMDYPLQIEDFKPLTRDEIYSGKRFL